MAHARPGSRRLPMKNAFGILLLLGLAGAALWWQQARIDEVVARNAGLRSQLESAAVAADREPAPVPVTPAASADASLQELLQLRAEVARLRRELADLKKRPAPGVAQPAIPAKNTEVTNAADGPVHSF